MIGSWVELPFDWYKGRTIWSCARIAAISTSPTGQWCVLLCCLDGTFKSKNGVTDLRVIEPFEVEIYKRNAKRRTISALKRHEAKRKR